MALSRRAVFLDKDGTLVPDIPYNCEPSRMSLTPGTGEALRQLASEGFQLVVVSNQSGVARGMFPQSALAPVARRLEQLCADEGVELAGIYFCTHLPEAPVAQYRVACGCRKPLPGLLLKAARELDLDLRRSWMVGDILNDVEAGNAAGCRTVLLDNGNETEWQVDRERMPHHIVHDLREAAAVVTAVERLRTAAVAA